MISIKFYLGGGLGEFEVSDAPGIISGFIGACYEEIGEKPANMDILTIQDGANVYAVGTDYRFFVGTLRPVYPNLDGHVAAVHALAGKAKEQYNAKGEVEQ